MLSAVIAQLEDKNPMKAELQGRLQAQLAAAAQHQLQMIETQNTTTQQRVSTRGALIFGAIKNRALKK